jgi:hypothetical protein
MTTTPNGVLGGLLEEANWSPRALAREINKLFGHGTVSDTAPYYWRDSGGVPHTPLPMLAAYVLSRHLGRSIEPRHIWQNADVNSPSVVPAISGFDLPWSVASTKQVAQEWAMSGLIDRRAFLAVSGAALARAVWVYLDQTAPGRALRAATVQPDSPLIAQIEQSIPLLQQLDDAKGGAANLSYVGAQVRAVALVLAENDHDKPTTRRLMAALAELGQLAGWMAFDANQHGLAQRYLFTALRAAHDADDSAMAGHVLADLSVQATTLGHPNDAVTLGEAAARTAARSAVSVRASITSRLAHAYAGAGRTGEFDEARGKAKKLLDKRRPGSDPRWMYYLTTNHLDCQAGYSLILLGRRQQRSGDAEEGKRHIRDGQRLLLSGAHDLPLEDPSQRRALYEGAWLALGCSARGQLEEACNSGRTAIGRLGQVRSPRSTGLLRQLETDLSRRARNRAVAEFLPDLHRALA